MLMRCTDALCDIFTVLQNNHGFSLCVTLVSSEPVIHVSLGISCVYLNKLTRVFGQRRAGPALHFLTRPPPLRRRILFSPISVLRPLASHNLVSQRQSVVVLTVKMVDSPINFHQCSCPWLNYVMWQCQKTQPNMKYLSNRYGVRSRRK